MLSKGPHGETPVGAEAVELTDEEVAQIKEKKATAALVMHYAGNDWANAQIAGLKAEFARLGIDVIAVTDANFNPGQQVSNIETVLAKHPDIVVSIPTDPGGYRRSVPQGCRKRREAGFHGQCPRRIESWRGLRIGSERR